MDWATVTGIAWHMAAQDAWRVMEFQQRAAGRWVARLFNTETKARAEIHSREGWLEFRDRHLRGEECGVSG